MKAHHYRDLLRRAVLSGDDQTLDMLAHALLDAERAKQILRADRKSTRLNSSHWE